MSGAPSSDTPSASQSQSDPARPSTLAPASLPVTTQPTIRNPISPSGAPINSAAPPRNTGIPPPAPTSRPSSSRPGERQNPNPVNPPVRKSILVPRDAVGFIIGRRGETVRNMMDRSKAYIHVDRDDTNPNAPNRLFHIQGDQEAVATARNLIKEKVHAVLHGRPHVRIQNAAPTASYRGPTDSSSSGPPSSTGDLASNASFEGAPQPHDVYDDGDVVDEDDSSLTAPLEMWIPRGCVGMIIGHGGQVINEMQEKAGATIVVHNNRMDNTGSKLLTISGGEREKLHAKTLIESVLDRAGPRPRFTENSSPSSSQANHQHARQHQTQHQQANQRLSSSDQTMFSPRDHSNMPTSLPHSMSQAPSETFTQQNPSQFLHAQHHGPPWPFMPPHGMYDPRTIAELLNMQQTMGPWGIPVQRGPGMPNPLSSQYAQSPEPQPNQTVVGPRGTIMRGTVPFGHQTQNMPILQAFQPPSQPQTPTLRETQTQTDITSPLQQLRHATYPPTPPQPAPLHTPQTYESSKTPTMMHGNPSTPIQLPQAHGQPMMGPVNQQQQFFPMQGQNMASHSGARQHIVHDGRPFHPGVYPGGGYTHPQTFYGSAMSQQPGIPGMGWSFGVPFEGGVLQPGPMFKPQMRYMRVPAQAVGTIIGRNGETIRDLQQRSGAVIHLDAGRGGQSEEPERLVYISGSEAAAKIAQGLVEDVLTKGSARFFGPDRRDNSVARTSEDDKAGGTNSPLRTELDSGGADSRRKRPVAGDPNGETHAEDRLEEEQPRDEKESEGQEARSSSHETQGENSQALDEGQTVDNDELGTVVEGINAGVVSLEMSIPDAKVGMIIGKRGATIKQLQQHSKARIAVSKEMDVSQVDRPRVVRITGMRSQVEEARRLILGKIDRPIDRIGLEGSDGNGGDSAETDKNASDFVHTGFSGAVGMMSGIGQLHPMGLPMSPMEIGQISPYGRDVGMVTQSGMGVYVTGGFPGMLRQDVDPSMENRYPEEGYFDRAYVPPYEGSGSSDVLPARQEVKTQEQEPSTSNGGEPQETVNNRKTAVSESLKDSRESEKQKR